MREHKRAVLTIVVLVLAISPAPCQESSLQLRDQRVLQIQQLISSNKLDRATQLLNKFSSQYPSYSGFYNLRGIIAAREGATGVAERSFLKAIQLSPQFTAAYLNLGRLYQEASGTEPGSRQKALHIYARILKYDAHNREAQYQLAFLLTQKGDYRRSLDEIRRMSPKMKSSAPVLSLIASNEAVLGHAKQASESVSQWMSQPPLTDPDVQQTLPYLAKGKRYDLIVKLLEQLQKQETLPSGILNSLGLAYEATGRLESARRTFEDVFAQSTSSAAPLLELASVANRQRYYKKALGYLAHAQVLEPKNPEIDYSFGVDCLYLGLLAESQKAFSKSVQLAPDNASYNYAMGITTSFMHDPNEGVPYLEKYVKLRPKDANGVLAVGEALFRAKDYDNAMSWLSKASTNPLTSSEANYYLGRIANRQRRTADAIKVLEEVLKAKPDDSNAWAELGQSYLLQKDYPKAEAELQRALVLDPNNYTANFNLLMAYTHLKDPRRTAQASRVQAVQKLESAKKQEYLRVLDIRPHRVE